jgi:hypothetical protein
MDYKAKVKGWTLILLFNTIGKTYAGETRASDEFYLDGV